MNPKDEDKLKWNFVLGQLRLEEDDDDEYLVIVQDLRSNSETYQLKKIGRILLYAAIKIALGDGITYIDVFHTHFGLDAQDHCWNVMEIMKLLINIIQRI